MSGKPGSASEKGDTHAEDIVGRKAFSRVKIAIGASGVDDGNVSTATPLPIVIPSIGTELDAFGRLRVSQLQVLGFKSFEYGFDDLFMEKLTVGTGAIESLANESALSVSTGGTAAGAKAILATKKFHRYVPGRSQLIRWTGTFAVPKVGVRQRVGYFGDRNGLFLEWDGTDLYFVRRTYTSGTVVDNRIPRSQWHDPFDGTGPSKVDLDLEGGTSYLAWIDMEWLGVGRYRFGFASPTTGELLVAYYNSGTNQLTVPYITTASLPVRYEIENTATAASSSTLKCFCYSVDSEGGDEQGIYHYHTVDMGTTPKQAPSGAFDPVLAIRARTTVNGGAPNRGQIRLASIGLTVTGSNAVVFRTILNPTTLFNGADSAGGGWIESGHIVEYAAFSDLDDNIGGGFLVDSITLPATNQSKTSYSMGIIRDLPIVYSELNGVQDTFVIAAAGIGGVSNVFASISFRELF